jgi:hypothetical protein
MIGVITGKRPENLTEEDYGKAVGILEVTSDIQKNNESRRQRQEIEVVEPSGKRTNYTLIEHNEAIAWIEQKLIELAASFSLSGESAKAVAITAICRANIVPASADVQTDDVGASSQLVVATDDRKTGVESTQSLQMDQSE